MTDSAENTRVVRPWIAALLTIFGWGVGFYYARRKSAWSWAVAQVLVSVSVSIALIAVAYFVWPNLFAALGEFGVSMFGWGMTLLVAAFAWAAASRDERVQRAGAARLFGYFLIMLTPLLVSLAFGFGVRWTLVQPFRQPSGSMQPTIEVGEYFLVNKRSYGYSRYSAAPFQVLFPSGRLYSREPRRGDVVVFRPVPDPDRDFVKRVVGLPGDRIQMIDGVLHINGEAVARESVGVIAVDDGYGDVESIPAIRETLPNGVSYTTLDRAPRSELDNTREFIVPSAHYFMMGDDRDNSADSRVASVVGYVPYDNLIGRVDHIFRERDDR